MIGRLSGLLAVKGTDHVLLDVQGVGYIVHVAERTLATLPPVGAPITLYTDLLVREDLMQLFGFSTLEEREWHKLLMRVQGIGAKASMAILGTLGAEGVTRAIALGDWAAVKAAPGVGPKIAQRVVNELKDKAPEVMSMAVGAPPTAAPATAHADTSAPAEPAPMASGNASRSEALSALTNLGYAPAEASRAIAEADGDTPGAETATLIRLALKRLAPGG